ncbi:MAG: glycosyltransferase family 1 protein [bacterium]
MNTHPAIALNGRFTGTLKPTGTQTAAFHLFDAIVRVPRAVRLLIFADPKFPGVEDWAAMPQTEIIPVPFQSWNRWKAQLWEQFVFPLKCRKAGVRVAHHPITTCPRWKWGMRNLVTVHDINFFMHPEWFSRSFRAFYKLFSIPGIRKAEAIGVISHYVKQTLVDHLKLPPERITVIYNGVKSLPSTAPHGQVPPYILCVGSLQPHKNLIRTIEAFLTLRHEFPQLELRIVGRPQANFQMQPQLAKLLQSPGVHLLGYLSEADLAEAYQQAQVFCFPSLEEGFGLPVLEAMMAETRVVTSNVSCLPEIAGPAAILVNPHSEKEIAAALREVLTESPERRKEQLVAAKKWAEQFSWERAAAEYVELYHKLAS